MDMKHILQALDKASSRKVEGADDMRRFVSAVRVLNAPIEEASGYIPKNKKEAKDPRWSNALTVDIQPGAVEKNLKALGLAEGKKTFADYLSEASKKCNHTAEGESCPVHGLDECGTYEEDISEVAGPEKCWPGHRKVGTKPGTGKNKGKRVNDCEKI
jgi:hypothetical protein